LELETLNLIEAHRVSEEVAAADLDHPAWRRASAVPITQYWSGERAPEWRHLEARLVWSRAALGVRFVCRQGEPLVVSAEPQRAAKTIGLWERDVCEIFIAPDPSAPERYFEFEAAPTGEWLDLGIEQLTDERRTDWEFRSGMTVAALISADQVKIAMRIPWASLGRLPEAGERWRVNLFRCVGAGTERGYLAWRPTLTALPNFHVPQAFGWLEMKG
jgi:Carbohydrate family 9 binding domain-like